MIREKWRPFLFIIAIILSLTACKKEPTIQDYLDLGQRYLTELNYEEAIVAFTAAIQIEEKNVTAYQGLASAYRSMFDADPNYEALESGISVLESGYAVTQDELLKTALAELYKKIADGALAAGDWEKAVQYYEKLAEWFPEDMEIIQKLADAYREGGDKDKSTQTLQESDYVIQWTEPAFEKLLREYLHKEEGEIRTSELDFVSSIDIYGEEYLFINGIDKDGVDFMTNRKEIAELYFEDTPTSGTVNSAADLQHFHNLKELGLYSNSITDISEFSRITWLQRLWLWNNQISDISGLENMESLVSLDISKNNISDISPLASLTNLEQLWVWENPISDITALGRLTNLSVLRIHKTQVTDIGALHNMDNLGVLDISDTEVQDISAVAGMSSLKSLIAYNTAIQDWEPAEALGVEIMKVSEE